MHSLTHDACPDDSQLYTLNKILKRPYGIHILSGGAGTGESFQTHLRAFVFIMQGKCVRLAYAGIRMHTGILHTGIIPV
jgi:hypothetical protein